MICEEGVQQRKFERRCFQTVAIIVVAALALAGCHKTITQQPPSLGLPGPVKNLAAVRGDNMVWLTWTMPQRTTDKRRIKGDITAQVCRRENVTEDCTNTGKSFLLRPDAQGSFSELLSPELASGTPRPLYYFVELTNRDGHSEGLVNGVWTLAGSKPLPVLGLTAEMHEGAVLLRWPLPVAGNMPDNAVIRVYRKLLTSAPSTQAQNSPTLPSTMTEQNLLVESDAASGHFLDKNVRYNETYEYRAQCVAKVTVIGQTLELAGEFSLPIRIATGNAQLGSTR